MRAMKLRLLLMGVILSLLGVVLLVKRGYSVDYLGLMGAGVVLFVAGLALKQGPGQGVSSSPA